MKNASIFNDLILNFSASTTGALASAPESASVKVIDFHIEMAHTHAIKLLKSPIHFLSTVPKMPESDCRLFHELFKV